MNENTRYLETGQAVELIQELDNGQFVVSPLYPNPYNDDLETGHPFVVDQLFATDEIPKYYSDQVKKLRDRIEAKLDHLDNLRAEVLEAGKQRADLLKKIEQIPILKNIVDIIEGNFTHFVVRDRYGKDKNWLCIKTKDEVLTGSDRYSQWIKLLTLYGGTKGDLQWNVNAYSDGSGNESLAFPCVGLEDARETLSRVLLEVIDRELKEEKLNCYQIKRLSACALAQGVEAPERLHIEAAKFQEEDRVKGIAETTGKIAKLQEQLEKLQSKSADEDLDEEDCF